MKKLLFSLLITMGITTPMQHDYDELQQRFTDILAKNIPEKDKATDLVNLIEKHPELKNWIAGFLFRNRGTKAFNFILSTRLFNPNQIVTRAGQSLVFLTAQEYVVNNLQQESLKQLFAVGGTLSPEEIDSLKRMINNLKEDHLFNDMEIKEMYDRLEIIEQLLNQNNK